MTKNELRAACRERRQAIPPEGKRRLDEIICSRIAESALFDEAEELLLYAPIKGEIDLLPLISHCRRLGKRVAFPVTRGDTMVFRYLEEGEQLSPSPEDRFCIPEPPAHAPIYQNNPKTLCILPALCLDERGNRLGYGKGYYDRFLETFEGVTLGAVYEKLMAKEVPAEEHDRPVQYLVNERRLFSAVPVTDEGGAAFGKERGSAWRQAVARILQPIRQRRLHRTESASNSTQSPLPFEAVHTRHAAPLLVLATFLLLILSRFIEGNLSRRGSEYVAVILLQILIFVLPALIFLQVRGERFSPRIRWRWVRPEHLWFCLCVLAVMITGSLLISIATGGISSLGGTFTLYDTFTARSAGGVWETVYIIIAYALLPAVCEELIYRSILCAEYEGAGTGIAVLVSSLFFAMLHFSFPLFPNYLFSGLLLAISMYTTRSAMAPMLLHACYNLFCLFGQPYLSAFYVNAGSNDIFIFCLVVLFLLFAAFGAGEARKIYYLYAKANLSSSYTSPVPLADYPKRLWRVCRSPLSFVLIAVWLVMAILAVVR